MAQRDNEVRARELIRKRGTIRSRLTGFSKYLQASQTAVEADLLAFKLERVRELFREFESVQYDLEAIASDEEYEQRLKERDEISETFENTIIRAERRLRSVAPSLAGASSAANAHSGAGFDSPATTDCANSNSAHASCGCTHTQLPRLKLPDFHGTYEDWPSFRDAFRASVHENTRFSDSQRLAYLKSCLTGKAAAKIESLEITAENYSVAWGILQKNYDDPYAIMHRRIQACHNIPTCAKASVEGFANLADEATKQYRALQKIGKPFLEAFPIYLFVSKMDAESQLRWRERCSISESHTMEDLLDFLHTRRKLLEDHASSHGGPTPVQPRRETSTRERNNRPAAARALTANVPQCPFCKRSHTAYRCDSFLAVDVGKRITMAKQANLCLNCLKRDHATRSCTMKTNCLICQKRHHTLLHSGTESRKEPEAGVSSLTATMSAEILLSTAVVDMLDHAGKSHPCRVLLDTGAQSNFLSESFAAKLGLHMQRVDMPVSGISEVPACAKFRVATRMRSRATKTEFKVEFLVIPRITTILPAVAIPRNSVKIPRNLPLADPHFFKPAGVDALLGVELFYELLRVGQVRIPGCTATLQKTQLGWVISGNITAGRVASRVTCNLSLTTLDRNLARFWEVEESFTKAPLSTEEQYCETHYRENVERDAVTGRYTVRLPFKDNKNELGDSYGRALRRLHAIERALSRRPKTRQQYQDFMREYEALGHMSEVEPQPSRGYYLPHHGVAKASSSTTKLRVVFDASAESTSGISLNDTLMIGPVVQDDLFSTIVRFRSHRYAMTADIEKMYRQVNVHPADRPFQRVLWREDPSRPVRAFELNTVTYGTAPASFLATRTLIQLAVDEGSSFPRAAQALREDFYVDDLLTGAPDLPSAKILREQLISLTARGGFHLRQWASNDPSLLGEGPQSADKTVSISEDAVRKTLGVFWHTARDTLAYQITQPLAKARLTKRSILSEIAQLFDPLGLLGPVITRAKLIMQELWKAQVDWDETVPPTIHAAWQSLRDELPLLAQVSIDRAVLLPEATDARLTGFCDASERAYGAAIYLRSKNRAGKTHVRLICAKSRVAPLKTLSLPRLELCAAALLARLVGVVRQALRHTRFDEVVLWTDSTIAIHWIRTPPHLLKTFVAHRVAEIQGTVPSAHWRHVRSADNPADAISRGMTPRDFLRYPLWFDGPGWLVLEPEEWPVSHVAPAEIPELKPVATFVMRATDRSLITRFSDFRRACRVISRCLRFAENCRNPRNRSTGPLSVKELERARTSIIKAAQVESFATELGRLRSGLPLTGALTALKPFIGPDGVLRVGGRLVHAELPYEETHPALLPRSHHLSRIIIRHCHVKNYHAGNQATLAALRTRYWIPGAKNAIKREIHHCVTCRRAAPRLADPLMGDLPPSRVRPARPFSRVGIDYCGPIMIKEKALRNRGRVKAYIAVFVCFVTRAVHLEVSADLSTDGFLAAFRRFIARRGRPAEVFSDNGTNFVGACRELRESGACQPDDKEWRERVSREAAEESITWHFIPPRSPHFGGLWEAAVKAFKRHFTRVIGETLLTYEQLYTYAAEIEAILNSRPLSPLSSDPQDLAFLTPGHFLIGDALTSLPQPPLDHIPVNRLSAWQAVQRMRNHFWHRWRTEYLHGQTVRRKWHAGSSENLAEGALVIIREDNAPPMRWPMGRVLALHPGDDGVVRVVSVRTARGVYKRSVRNLAPLLLDDHQARGAEQLVAASDQETPATAEPAHPIADQPSGPAGTEPSDRTTGRRTRHVFD